MAQFDHSTFISPFTWRYGSEDMRYIFSEKNKYLTWRKIWVQLAKVQCEFGFVSKKELADLKKHEQNVDVDRILEIEKETRHDVVAAVKEFAEKAKLGGGKIHLGATSMDIVDNADMIRIKEALLIVEKRIKTLLLLFRTQIEKYAEFPCIGYTHLQPAEPITVGYRFAFYAQDILGNLEYLDFIKKTIKGKGMKGAVGTSASYKSLFGKDKEGFKKFEAKVMYGLDLTPALITSQVYPRQYDYLVLSLLASLAGSISKFAADLRILQSPSIGEWSEPFGKKQVGSSAMPFKKNPISSENICSLGRYVMKLPEVALENAALSYLERTLDDSANKRLIISEGFLAVDQMLISAEKILSNIVINEDKITKNLETYAPFAATEAILMQAVKSGGNRQKLHEALRNISMEAWNAIQNGKTNPIKDLLKSSKELSEHLTKEMIDSLLDVTHHIGDAPNRALILAKKIRKAIKNGV